MILTSITQNLHYKCMGLKLKNYSKIFIEQFHEWINEQLHDWHEEKSLDGLWKYNKSFPHVFSCNEQYEPKKVVYG